MPASWWGQETPGWSGHFCCLSAAVCGNLKPRLIAKDPWQVTNTWDNLRLFNTFRNKIRNIWKHIIMRWSMGWCKGTCARKTMFVYMFYTMVLAPIRSFSLFFSLQFSRLSWSRRSQGTHFHQVIGICDAAAASDPQRFSMGSIFFIKKKSVLLQVPNIFNHLRRFVLGSFPKMMAPCEKTQSLHWNHFWSWMLDIFDFSPHLDSTKGSFTIMHQPETFRHNVGISQS